ncbi:SRPBCC family protein [Sphingomonas cavernae]|uniref:SRPBCC domain-containing protein n=1 Tax=Sphingomonas cavernae TaxID=2320861 RepID=A0A418WP71_9SPHN|nr:hypothetical protein [Sphingomonas cavernae]RJF93036.1 hypothetical protein D3876_01230 [Sphingomonas cavernae]
MPEMPSTRDRILVEVTIAAPADAVWEAIRDPAKIHNWFGWDADTLSDEIDFIFARHVRPEETARILHFKGMPDRFEVEARGDTSLLRIVRATAAEAGEENVYDDIVEGWISFVQQLRLALEQHNLGTRRTIYLEGAAKPGGSAPIAALGLTEHSRAPAGNTVRAKLASGDKVDGIAWHRTPFQCGVTVPQWGDGLLIVTDKPTTETSPDGRGMVILTTYGLSDAAFGELEARWKLWWDAHFMKAAEPSCS